MPVAEINGQSITYADSGGDGPAIIWSHGFLMDHTMFDEQVSVFGDRYRCIRWDERAFGGEVRGDDQLEGGRGSDDLYGGHNKAFASDGDDIMDRVDSDVSSSTAMPLPCKGAFGLLSLYLLFWI